MHVELLHHFSAKNSGKMARSLRERQSKGETMSAGKFYTRRGTMERIRCIMCFVQRERGPPRFNSVFCCAKRRNCFSLMWLFDSLFESRSVGCFISISLRLSKVIIAFGIDISSYYYHWLLSLIFSQQNQNGLW